jgi:hypothetical protein
MGFKWFRASIGVAILCLGFALVFAAQQGEFKHFQDENDKQQLALEGKKAPPIVSTEWLNSKPLTWSELKGKVVLVDIWAFW